MNRRSVLAVVIAIFAVTTANANQLRPETLQSWNGYIQSANLELNRRVGGQRSFLSLDERPDLAQLVRQGQTVAFAPEGMPQRVPHGLIHDWIGDVFIPNAKLGEVLAVLADFDHYKDFYKPMVADSRVMERNGANERFTLLMMDKAFSVIAAIDTENDVHTVRLGTHRAYIVSYATRLQEISDFGQPTQKKLPQDCGPGFIWRLQNVIRAEQRDDGVYLEIETTAMSRGIPAGMRWLFTPLTERIPRNRMLLTLDDTRKAVVQSRVAATK
jgi:hypothetical protein